MAHRSAVTKLLMGQCMPCLKQNASKVKVKKMELDTNLNMVNYKNYLEKNFN